MDVGVWRNNLTSSLFSFSGFYQHQKSKSCLEDLGRGLGWDPLGSWLPFEQGVASRPRNTGTTVYIYFIWIFLFPPSTALLPYLNASMSLFIGIFSSLARPL